MLGKTLILGLISAGAAGAIVYYGTAPQGSEALESHPHNDARVEKSIETKRERIEPRLPTVRKAEDSKDDDGRKKLASGQALSESTAETAPPPTDTQAAPKKQTRWLDQYLKKNNTGDAAANVEGLDVEMFDAPQGGADSAVNSYAVDEFEAIDDIEPDAMDVDAPALRREATREAKNDMPDNTDARTFRIENGKLVEITASGVTDVLAAEETTPSPPQMKTQSVTNDAKPNKLKITSDMHSMADDSTPLLSTVMKEASAITKAELRDQAYFEITEFALSEGRFESARIAHDMIDQDELAYTAKSRIAVAFAQNGQPTEAFKVIGEVDEAELRDFMRLQVKEALIAPQRLPESWQQKAN